MDQGGWTAVEYSAAIIVVAGAVYYYMKFIKKDWSFLIVLKINQGISIFDVVNCVSCSSKDFEGANWRT